MQNRRVWIIVVVAAAGLLVATFLVRTTTTEPNMGTRDAPISPSADQATDTIEDGEDDTGRGSDAQTVDEVLAALKLAATSDLERSLFDHISLLASADWTEREQMRLYIQFNELCATATVDQVLNAVIPMIEDAEHEVRELIQRALGVVCSQTGKPAYEALVPSLRDRSDEEISPLLDFLFDISASEGAVLLVLRESEAGVDSSEDSDLIQAFRAYKPHVELLHVYPEQKRNAAIAEFAPVLAEMSRDSRWYIRYYVAQVLAKQPYLRREDTLNVLRGDENAMVRELARSIL